MSRHLRLALLITGLLLLLFGVAALAYALWPIQGMHDAATLAPTLFAPP